MHHRNVARSVELFAELSDDDFAVVAAEFRERRAKRNQVLFQEGDSGESLLIVVSGRLKVSLENTDGEEVILALLGPGHVVGELSLLDELPRSATVTAIEATAMLTLPRTRFLNTLRTHPSVLDAVLQTLAARLRATNEHVRTLALYDLSRKIVRTLAGAHSGDPEKSGLVVSPRPSHDDIARMVGHTREAVSRAMGDLRRRGIVAISDRKIVLNRDRVRAFLNT